MAPKSIFQVLHVPYFVPLVTNSTISDLSGCPLSPIHPTTHPLFIYQRHLHPAPLKEVAITDLSGSSPAPTSQHTPDLPISPIDLPIALRKGTRSTRNLSEFLWFSS